MSLFDQEQEKGEVGVTLKLRGRGVFEKGDAGDVGRGVLERRQGVTLFEEANGLSWSLSPVSYNRSS